MPPDSCRRDEGDEFRIHCVASSTSSVSSELHVMDSPSMTGSSSFALSNRASVGEFVASTTARWVTNFRMERRREIQTLFHRVVMYSYCLVIIGLVVAFSGYGLYLFVGPPIAMRLVIAVGYMLISVGTILFSSCDPQDTNIDTILRKQPRKRTCVLGVCVVGAIISLSNGEVLSIVIISLALCTIRNGRVMVFFVHALSVALLAPLARLRLSSSVWSITCPFTIMVSAPRVVGFLCIQAHWLYHIVYLRDDSDADGVQETTAFYEEVNIFLLTFAAFHAGLGIECFLVPTSISHDESTSDCLSYGPPTACLAFPPLMLFVLGRHRWFSFAARRFNRSSRRTLKGAAFISQLFDSMRVDVGEEWWCLREVRDESFPEGDHRHHFRKGVVVSVRNTRFTVEFPTSTEGKPNIVSFPAAGRSSPTEELIEHARGQLRCMSWEHFSLELLSSGPICGSGCAELAENRMLQSSRPLLPDERIDFFLSHCWYDDAAAKYEALRNLVDRFKLRHGRNPTFWFDKTCLDQRCIADGLRVLPLTVMSCDHLVMLFTTQYTRRLWCVWELFTILAFFPPEEALDKIVHVPISAENDGCAYEALSNFQAGDAKCFDPNDENRLRKVITALGEESFNSRIRQLGNIWRQRQLALAGSLSSSRSICRLARYVSTSWSARRSPTRSRATSSAESCSEDGCSAQPAGSQEGAGCREQALTQHISTGQDEARQTDEGGEEGAVPSCTLTAVRIIVEV